MLCVSNQTRQKGISFCFFFCCGPVFWRAFGPANCITYYFFLRFSFAFRELRTEPKWMKYRRNEDIYYCCSTLQAFFTTHPTFRAIFPPSNRAKAKKIIILFYENIICKLKKISLALRYIVLRLYRSMCSILYFCLIMICIGLQMDFWLDHMEWRAKNTLKWVEFI